jgi:hypothetical protein
MLPRTPQCLQKKRVEIVAPQALWTERAFVAEQAEARRRCERARRVDLEADAAVALAEALQAELGLVAHGSANGSRRGRSGGLWIQRGCSSSVSMFELNVT